MKKIMFLSICASFVLAGFINPLPNSSRSTENGGTLSAIDAYQDGVGAMVIENGRGIDNSAMNSLVFKYGNQAKSNILSVGDQVLLSGTAEDKLLAGKLFADGVTCNDSNPVSTGETYLNGICQGGVLPANGTACNDNNIQTITDIYTDGVCAGTNVQGLSCDDSNAMTYGDSYNNGVCISGAYALSCKTIKTAVPTSATGIYSIDPDGVGGAIAFNVYCDMTTDGGGWTLALNSDFSDDAPKPDLYTYTKNPTSPSIASSHFLGLSKLNLTSANTIKFECQDRFSGSTYNFYHRNVSNMVEYFNFSGKSYTGTIECSGTNNFSGASTSVASCIQANDQYHRYYSYGNGNIWAHFLLGTPAFLRHCGPGWYGDGSAGSMNHKSRIWVR